MGMPTFFVVGAARCGTTSLHYYLAQHPEICMSTIKEPNHFLFRQTAQGPVPCIADDRRLLAKSVPDRARYERLFARAGRAVGEASPLYLYTRETPQLIRDAVPDAKLVAVVREPVSRAWSHFAYVNAGHGGDHHLPAAFAVAAERELPLGYAPYRTGTHYLRLSAYAEQLERYAAVFPADRLLVVSYDELTGNTRAVLAQVCDFLGVDAGFAFDTSVAYNPSSGDASWVGRLDRAARPLLPYLKKLLPARVSGRLARTRAELRAGHRGDPSTPIPAELRARLDEHFARDREWLARERGITFAGG